MKKILHKLGVLAAFFVAGSMTCFAQFSAEATADYDETYAITPLSISLSQLAETLGTDTIALTDALDSYFTDGSGNITFTLVYNGGASTYDGVSDCSSNVYGGFWMTADGNKTTWGETTGAVWCEEPSYDTSTDEMIFNCCQFPGQSSGQNCHANLQIAYNGKYAVIELAYNVKSKVEIIPNEGLTFSGLTQAGSADLTISVPKTTSSKANSYGFAVSDIADKLGVDKDELAKYFENYMFVRYYDEANSVMKDSINGGYTYTTNGNGYYWTQLTDDATGKVTEDCYSSTSTTEAVMYTYGYTYDGDSLYFYLGQYQGRTAENDTYKATVYLCNNEAQYYALNLTVNVTKSEALPFEKMTCAGTLNFSNKYVTASANTVQVSLTDDEVSAIENALNVENGDVVFYAYESEGVPSDNSTANVGGFWLNKTGYICNWADEDAAMYVQPVTANNFSVFDTGLSGKTALQDGDTATTSIIIMGETSYYQLNFEFIVKNVIGDLENWKVVATQEYEAQLVYSQGYKQKDAAGNAYTIKLDWAGVKEAIGATSISANDVYAWKTYQSEWIPDSLTNSNSCSGDLTGNGFYMSRDGRSRATWNDYGAYGIYFASVATDTAYTIFYVRNDRPDSIAAPSVDSTYVGEFFVANSNNSKVVKLVFTINFVNDPSERTTQVISVGSEKQTQVVTAESENSDADGYVVGLDLTNALAALGITEDELYSCTWRARNASGKYVNAEGFDAAEAVMFNAQGQMVSGDAPDQAYSFWYSEEAKSLCMSFLGESYPTEDFSCTIYLQLVYEGQSYGLTITVGSSEAAVGINSISNDVKAANKGIYTLAGQRVSNASKGLYIINGKKVLVK